MRILVTGTQGQVARCLAERAADGRELVFAGRPALDLADTASIKRAVDAAAPDLVFSVAAYTAVDRAEDEPELAMAINGIAPGALAGAAAKRGVPIIHLSTDYVFDGALDRPYRETDPVGPIGVYGASKLAGERAVAQSGARHAILRTSWVYSPFGQNFVRTMLRVAGDRDVLGVVEDQLGCPTSAHDIADAMLAVADAHAQARAADGVFHFAGTGATSWADFARAIFAASERLGGPSARVDGIATSAYPTRARRPANSRLDCTRFEEAFGFRAPRWQDALEPVVARLLA